jgi:sec-independent protein translocase protein TatC
MSKVVIGTFLEHLDEMRRRLWVAVAAFLAASAVSLFYADRLLEIALGPVRGQIGSLYFFSPSDAFSVKIKLALLSGVFVASPVILWQFWLFMSPAMRAHERKAVLPFSLLTSSLFIGGAAFGFKFVLPAALNFLVGMQTETLQPMISASEYLSFVSFLLVAFGFAFNLPVFVLLLVWSGAVNVEMLNQFQRQMVVMIFIASAILTPGPDIASQLMLAVPLLLLYEGSVLAAFVMDSMRRKKAKVIA